MRGVMRAAILGGAMVGGSLQAGAASFDCAKAVKPAELAICDDKALSAADVQLAAAYARLMADIPAPLKPALQKTQRNWVAYLPLACSSDGRGTVKDKATFTQCLKSEYDSRIATLAAEPKTIGGLKTVAVGEFQAMRSSSDDPEFFPIVTHVKSVAQVYGGDPARVAQLNAWLQSLGGSDKAGWDDPDTSASFSVSLESANDVVATAILASDIFGVGAAHPLAVSSSQHLVLATGKPLLWRDMFKPNARDRLTALAWTALQKKLGGDMMVENKSDLAKLVVDPGHWTFGANGLTINFNVYEVAAYVMGPQDITLPWAALRDVMTQFGRTVAENAQ